MVEVRQSPSKSAVFAGFMLFGLCLIPLYLIQGGFLSLMLRELGTASGWEPGDDVKGSGILIFALRYAYFLELWYT